jgi:hypothetical protein
MVAILLEVVLGNEEVLYSLLKMGLETAISLREGINLSSNLRI